MEHCRVPGSYGTCLCCHICFAALVSSLALGSVSVEGNLTFVCLSNLMGLLELIVNVVLVWLWASSLLFFQPFHFIEALSAVVYPPLTHASHRSSLSRLLSLDVPESLSAHDQLSLCSSLWDFIPSHCPALSPCWLGPGFPSWVSEEALPVVLPADFRVSPHPACPALVCLHSRGWPALPAVAACIWLLLLCPLSCGLEVPFAFLAPRFSLPVGAQIPHLGCPPKISCLLLPVAQAHAFPMFS